MQRGSKTKQSGTPQLLYTERSSVNLWQSQSATILKGWREATDMEEAGAHGSRRRELVESDKPVSERPFQKAADIKAHRLVKFLWMFLPFFMFHDGRHAADGEDELMMSASQRNC